MNKKWILYLIALIFIVGSTYGYVLFMNAKKQEIPMVMTYMPSRYLEAGIVITEDDITKVSINEYANRSDALHEKSEIIGKRVIVPIGTTEQFIRWKLSDVIELPVEDSQYYSFETDVYRNIGNLLRKGDRVDVWVEFETPKLVYINEVLWSVGAIKLIDDMYVASVKNAEGIEVASADIASTSIFVSDEQLIANLRAAATSTPSLNTYIMTEEMYNAYVIGSRNGTIKLSLANITEYQERAESVTELFTKLSYTSVFNSNLLVDGDHSSSIPRVYLNGETDGLQGQVFETMQKETMNINEEISDEDVDS